MILPRLRPDLDFMLSPDPNQPGLLIRDTFRYSDYMLVIPPPLISSLNFFDGIRTDLDLQTELTALLSIPESHDLATRLIESLRSAGFLVDETYARLKQARHLAFAESPVRVPVHMGSAYPSELAPLQDLMQRYLGSTESPHERVIGIAAPHVSPEGGWQCYRAAYTALTPDLRDRTFVVLGTSHYGQPDKFGLTRKPFKTPYGTTTTHASLVAELAAQPAALMEDYCHAVEHSIEFQVLFLQAIYGPEVRVLPILCGSFGRHVHEGAFPEDNDDVNRFLGALGEIADREKDRHIWVLGVDMAHMGMRYGDNFIARADQDQMTVVRERDQLRIDRVIASDATGFWSLVRENQDDDLKWCGSSAIYSFMKAVPQARGTLHRYEQWNIDEKSVVSFAGISFSDRSEQPLKIAKDN
ncbi:MAG: AmmeMemoRadiSam system protein B [Terracidiphilus sp.]